MSVSQASASLPRAASVRLDGVRITLVSASHPVTNPRLVKEADAFAEAGAAVRVVACRYLPWAERAASAFENRPWYPPEWVRYGPVAPAHRWQLLRARKKVAAAAALRVGIPEALGIRGLHYVVPELTRAAAAAPADLFVAHTLAALPAALSAARQHDAPVGYDAEDFDRGILPESGWATAEGQLIRWAEERFIPQAAYVTAASDGIGQAYSALLGIPTPQTILNVFPLAERAVRLSPEQVLAEKQPGTRTLYWFSQTVGAGRGLEEAVAALPYLPHDVQLAIRGSVSDVTRALFEGLARRAGVSGRLRFLPPVPPDELVPRAALHDIGLALEQPTTVNRDLCVTNKLFTYLLAGIPAVATDTSGQRGVCAAIPDATRIVPIVQPEALARGARELLDSPHARAAALDASERYNWDTEQQLLLRLAAATLHKAGRLS